MLRAAVLLPETALLVPGASGRTPVLATERAVVLDALDELLATDPDQVVVVAAGRGPRGRAVPVPATVRHGPFTPSLAAAGLDDDVLGWPADPSLPPGAPLVEVGPAVTLRALQHRGWAGPTMLVLVHGPEGVAAGAEALRRLDGAVAVVLVGSLSARRGPDAPLAEDPRAADGDAAVLAAMDGRAGDDASPLSPDLADALAISAWLPWQVLSAAHPAVGCPPGSDAAGTGWVADVRSVTAPFGATYAVVVWGDR